MVFFLSITSMAMQCYLETIAIVLQNHCIGFIKIRLMQWMHDQRHISLLGKLSVFNQWVNDENCKGIGGHNYHDWRDKGRLARVKLKASFGFSKHKFNGIKLIKFPGCRYSLILAFSFPISEVITDRQTDRQTNRLT